MNLHWLVDRIPSLPSLSNLPQGVGIGRLVTVVYGTVGSLLGGGQLEPAVNLNSLARLSSGCSATSTWKFDSTNHSNRTIGDRSFYVHIPPNYKSNVPHAVVLSFHGYKGSDRKQERISSLSKRGLTINGKGIIAVYPSGAWGPGKNGHSRYRAWQGAPYAKPGVNDIAFTKNIIDQVKANLCVDEKRIYASGKSNGGGFTNLLACTPSTASLIAAFAPVSPALYPNTHPLVGCNPGRAVPIIAFHGLADTVIPFNGRPADKNNNTAYALPNILEYRAAWATRNGCAASEDPTVSYPHEDTTLDEWDCSAANNNAVVKGYSVSHLGHSWPSVQGLDGGAASFDATPDDIVPFFDAHPLT